jgi:hypothetical protein
MAIDENTRKKIIRAGLTCLLQDKHERLVPDVLEWLLIKYDINRNTKIGVLLHFSAVEIQVKLSDHLFQICIKALGKAIICRAEEPRQPKVPPLEFIIDTFNPMERIQNQLVSIFERLDRLASLQSDNRNRGV